MITLAYGRHRSQVGDLHLPDGAAAGAADGAVSGGFPVVVVLHGGFWRARYGRWIMRSLAKDLAERGYAAWDLEYRRVGPFAGGGFPNTLDDVAAGIDHLASIAGEYNLDLDRVAYVGHSAGGHLSLWAAGRPDSAVTPRVAIAQAGVADLRMAHAMDLGAGIVDTFMGGSPEKVPERYAVASPIERVPIGVRQVLIHGRADVNVPVEVGRSYYEAAVAAGDDVEFLELDCDHMVLIDHHSSEWQLVLDRLP